MLIVTTIILPKDERTLPSKAAAELKNVPPPPGMNTRTGNFSGEPLRKPKYIAKVNDVYV